MWGAYYWLEERWGTFVFVITLAWVILARKTFGLVESLGPIYFFGAGIIILKVLLRTIFYDLKTQPRKERQ